MVRIEVMSKLVNLKQPSSPFYTQELLRESYAGESNESCAEPICPIIPLCVCKLYHDLENLAASVRDRTKPNLTASMATLGACHRGCGMSVLLWLRGHCV